MIKNRIAVKLSLYFLTSLVAFTLIIAGVFFFLFQSYITNFNQVEMETRANRIAIFFSERMSRPGPSFKENNQSIWDRGREQNQDNHDKDKKNRFKDNDDRPSQINDEDSLSRSYLHSLSNVSGGNIWIIDSNKQLLTSGKNRKSLTYKDLPPVADETIQKVFRGKTIFTQDFSPLIDVPTLTVGTPIKDSNGTVIGAVLLHRPISGINEIFEQGLSLLGGSILIALFLSLLGSIGLSYFFTAPLKRMKNTALKLAEGDYQAKNHLKLTDEIGQLGNAMDLLSQRLFEASKEKEKLDRFRDDFIVNISHELRTPITVIRGSLEALVDHIISKPDQVEEYHKQMLKEAILLQRLTNDLLEISKLQNNDFTIAKEKINLWDPLNDAIRSARSLAQNKEIEFNIVRDPEPYLFDGDYDRLRQLFLIILDNAIKFSPCNGKIDITQKGQQISIRDYGKGIDKKDLPHIFDRFYQSSSMEESRLGTGLGLAIAKQIANRHHILLTAKSQDPGAQFDFELPSESLNN